ncbi:MAG: hypothetical protein JWR40_3182, partial [Massilia sp.]|nr:hypothetical protein [Massilia sp.]
MEDLSVENEDHASEGATSADKLKKFILEIERFLELIHGNEKIKIPNPIRKYLFGIGHFKDEIRQLLQQPVFDLDAISTSVREMGTRANKLLKVTELNVDDVVPRDHIHRLHGLIKEFERSFLGPVSASALSSEHHLTSRVDFSKLAAGLEILSTQLLAVQNESKRSRKYILESQKQAEDVSSRLANFDERLVETLNMSSARVETVLLDLEEKQREVNELVGAVTGSAMAGSYSTSAESERKLAEGMRNGSVLLMLIISCLVGYSLLETTQPHFDWQIALFRLLFSLELSV